ncbi:LOW QUALITY PROTEIN: hypothetical protein E2986_11069 [Frieseomelitta varia]|uniref:Uncharacterized protein n=1 Tax=Frieseomelitta varia TaxID=561572 RepID=A0A833W920_9HYME|nr:LOW QUALITY PROTEIN: hypothetical protein E2986_11069 [Frieseomelitta varia]
MRPSIIRFLFTTLKYQQFFIAISLIMALILNKLINKIYRDNIKTAQQYFQLVGSSASECDTIPGRQCMASCFFLYRQFEEVLISN